MYNAHATRGNDRELKSNITNLPIVCLVRQNFAAQIHVSCAQRERSKQASRAAVERAGTNSNSWQQGAQGHFSQHAHVPTAELLSTE
eukprot:6214458-Pleurochrysis_carterae.AAC.3